MSKAAQDDFIKYMATQPEFMNFTSALFNDLLWSFRLVRFQDNGRWEEEDESWIVSFVDYITENLNMVSQWRQGIESFWPARPILEQARSIWQHIQNPTIYKDTYWIWAFFNALWNNVWRQRKPYNWIAKALWAYTTDWWWWAKAYIENERRKLSFGSLRYMVNEDMSSYWYTHELTWEVWWIPSIIMWESERWSDKEFNYDLDDTETWETMKAMFNWDLAWDDRWAYWHNLLKNAIKNAENINIIPIRRVRKKQIKDFLIK